jgi:hypothetical protein
MKNGVVKSMQKRLLLAGKGLEAARLEDQRDYRLTIGCCSEKQKERKARTTVRRV